ncbi:MAG: hypothetical protein ACI85O_001941 [Saprospiraceae bacterium]|jgi:hypothetical protein
MSIKIKRIPVDSSMLSAIGYDASTKILYAEFVNTGKIYAYSEVSEEEFTDLQDTHSVGGYFRNNILDFYTGVQVRRGRSFKW